MNNLIIVNLCIYRCVPPTHEYGTRPFLRWARSQGRNPHASGKAKNTFGPVGIPLFGAPQAPGNKPTRRGYKPGGMAPWGQRKSPVPRHTRQNRPEVRRPTECNPRTGEERPHTNALERPRGPPVEDHEVWNSCIVQIYEIIKTKYRIHTHLRTYSYIYIYIYIYIRYNTYILLDMLKIF